MLKPVTLVCGHSGCQSCFARLIKEPIPKCPLCKKIHPRATALNVNIILNDIIDKLEIQCTNNGCQWQGTLESHTQHSNTCGKLPLNCPNRGCSEVKPRDEMTLHVSQCAKQDVACQDCGKKVTRDSMREHINSLCSHKRIPCPLSCGTNLPRYVFHNIIYFRFNFIFIYLFIFIIFVVVVVVFCLSRLREKGDEGFYARAH